jgi:uncharacterized RDD family membrane protein YckC
MVTPELIDYIKKARAAGQTDAQIKEALLKIGWDQKDINNGLNPPETLAVNYLENSSGDAQSQAANMEYAGFWIRFLASIIDGIMIFIPSSLFGILAVALGGGEMAIAFTKFLAIIIVGGIYIYIIYKYQASPGKMMLGLKIVSDNLERITFGQVLLREIVGKFVSGLILNIGYIMIAFTAKKQGLHDMIAKTLVIYKEK